MVYELSADDLTSLAINVFQNRWDWRKLRPDLFSFAAGFDDERKEVKRQERYDPVRDLLEAIYREVLRANREYVRQQVARRHLPRRDHNCQLTSV